jgi:uncharacterized protein YbaP (TraB family)
MQKLNKLAVALFFLFPIFAHNGQAETTACTTSIKQPTAELIRLAKLNAHDHGFLWRISKDGHTSYLYGTIHIGKYEWMFLGPQLMKAFRETDVVAVDMDIQKRLSADMEIKQHKQMPVPLQARIKRQAKALCVSYDAIAALPAEMQVTILTAHEGEREGLEPKYGIDMMLARMEHEAYKPVISLETPEIQLNLLRMQDADEAKAFVEDSLDDMESGLSLRLLDNIVQYWADSNYDKMAHYADWCECLNTEIDRTVMQRTLDERNPALAAHIDELHMGRKRVLAAVGSLHMFGESGLPVLMEKLGYKVEPISFK